MKIAIWCGIAPFLMGLLVQRFANNAAQVRVIYQMATQGKTLIVSEITCGTNPNEVFEKDRRCIETQGTSTNVLACNATVPREMKPPLLVFYGVGPFYQNIVTYLKSEVSKELMGKDVDDATREEKCLNKNFRERDGNNIVPCGAKAGSLFNDTLELQHNGNRIDINKERVAWKSDIMRYKNPKDYPNRPKTTWLYQLFPDVVKKRRRRGERSLCCLDEALSFGKGVEPLWLDPPDAEKGRQDIFQHQLLLQRSSRLQNVFHHRKEYLWWPPY